jgi:cytochrome c2
MHRRTALLAYLLLCLRSAAAMDLPPPEELEKSLGIHPESVTVVEPHESGPGRELTVSYTGFPVEALFDRWFGNGWSAQGNDLLFLARDGYRAAVAADAFAKQRAYLAFRRSDGAAFTVNTPEQNQLSVPLGPYYLIWDNRTSPDRLSLGAYGWPYQVTAIEIAALAAEQGLMPRAAGPRIEQGFRETKKFCLTCHQVRGTGGKKYDGDMVQTVCRWSDEKLKDWIRDPGALRPGTSMPGLNRGLPTVEGKRRSTELWPISEPFPPRTAPAPLVLDGLGRESRCSCGCAAKKRCQWVVLVRSGSGSHDGNGCRIWSAPSPTLVKQQVRVVCLVPGQ